MGGGRSVSHACVAEGLLLLFAGPDLSCCSEDPSAQVVVPVEFVDFVPKWDCCQFSFQETIPFINYAEIN